MTTTLPPSQQFTGIFYNPAFWTSADSGLTQELANTLYLEKTTPDTATALQTFSGGLSTQSITAPSLTSNVTLFGSQTAGTLVLATSARSVHVSNIDCQGNGINNASAPANGALTIGASQIAGTIEIGANVGRTGAITIGANNCTINYGGHLAPTYTSLPTTGELGHLTINTITGGTLTLGTTSAVIGSATLTTGVWLVQGNASLPTAVGGIVVTLSLSTGAGINIPCVASNITSTAGAVYINLSTIVQVSGSQTWGISGLASTASTIISNVRFAFTRIA